MTQGRGQQRQSNSRLFHHRALLKNPYIRSFLSNFCEDEWNVAVKYACIYGIQALSKHGAFSQLTTDGIAHLIRSNNAAVAVEAAMPALRSKLHRLHEDIDKFEYALGDGLGGASEAGATAGAASKNGRQAAKTTSTTTRTVTPTKRKPVRAFAQKRRQATIAGEKRDIPVVRHNLTSKYPFVDDRGTVEQIIEGAGDKLTSSIGVQTSRKAASGTDGTATPESNDVLDDDWVGGQDDDMVANASTAAESVAVSHTPAGYRYRNRKQAVTSTTQTPRGSASKAKGPSGTAAARRSRKYKHGKAGAKGKYGYPAGAAKKGGVTWGRGVPQHASAWCQPSVLPPPATTAAAAAAAAAGVAPGMAWVYPYPAVPSSTPCPVAAHAMGQPMMSPFFYGSPAMVPSYHQHPLQHPQQHWTQEQVAAAVAAAVASSKQPATVPPKATQGTHARPSATGASVARSRSNTQSAPKSKPRQDATAAEKPPSSGKRRTPATRVSTSAAVPAKATVVRPGRHAKKAAGGNSVSESTREAMRRDRAAARAAKARRPARPDVMGVVDSAGAPASDDASRPRHGAAAASTKPKPPRARSALDIADEFLGGSIMADLQPEASGDVWERILSDVGFELDSDDGAKDGSSSDDGLAGLRSDGLFDLKELTRASRQQLGYK